jgi:hypothetical protein
MAESDRNFIDYTLARAELKNKDHVMTPAELASEFAKLGPSDRIDHLMAIGGDLEGTILSVKEAAEIHAYRRALRNTHDNLTKINR